MKKGLILLLAVSLLLGCIPMTGAAAAGPRYTLENQTVFAGETFTMAVKIAENPGIISLRFRVMYDMEALELVKIEDTGLLKGWTTPAPVISSPYTLRWADALASADNTGSGTVVKLTFKALRDQTSQVKIEPVEARNVRGQKVSFAAITATVIAEEKPPYTLGDVDGNGKIETYDALMILYHINGRDALEGTELLAANVVGEDDTVDVWDVLQIIYYINHRIDHF